MSETMNNVDNFWLHMDTPTNLMVIAGFMEFEKPLDFDRLQMVLVRRLLCFDRFTKRVSRPASGVGAAVWRADRNFDIRSHVHRVALPRPGDQKELERMTGDLMTTPLDRTKPLWQVHLIENYGEGCVVVFRIHHCIADGIALIHVLLSLADSGPDTYQGPPKPNKKRSRPLLGSFSPFDSIVRNVRSAADAYGKAARFVLREISESVSDPDRLVALAKNAANFTVDATTVLGKLTVMPPDPKTVLKGRLGVRKRVAWTRPMPLLDVKTVGKAVEATLNDVLVAAVTGALRRYLIKRKSRVNELDLRVAVPVNIRKPGTEFELGNKFSLVFLSLPVHIEDPVLRLREVKRRMDELKRSPDAFVGFQVLNALGMSPAKIAKSAARLFSNKATAVLTNVPGPRRPLYLAGEKIANMMFWVPRTGGLSLGISILSYDGKVTVGVATDEGLIPDPESILDGFEEDFHYILDLAESGEVFGQPLVLHDRYAESLEKKTEAKAPGPADVDQENRCKATTREGKRCKNKPVDGSDYCSVHRGNTP